MATDRYVVLGLAPARAEWFAAVARWATSAALPVAFVKVVAVEEARARLRSGRPFSALLVGATTPGLDRDVVELATAAGCAVVVVDDGAAPRRWLEIGAAAVLATGFGREQLLDTLRTTAAPIERHDTLPERVPAVRPATPPQWRGRLVAVTGAGGVGRSTLAMALATGLADDPGDRGRVVLADLALHAQQALLHDAGDVVPGLLELVEAHRGVRPSQASVRALCFAVPEPGYDLLLGLRRHRDWTALRPGAVAAAIDGLRRSYRLVVADVDPDVEGEAECGSLDVEERNALARTALPGADVVAVVGQPGPTGVHGLLRVIRDLVELGVAARRIVPVVNRAPRHPRARAELTAALGRLLDGALPDPAVAGRRACRLACTPVFVRDRRGLDDVLRDGAALPDPLVAPLAGAVRGLLARLPATRSEGGTAGGPVPVAPGSLATWSDHEEAG